MPSPITTQGTDFNAAPQSFEAQPVVSESSATFSVSDYDQEVKQTPTEPTPQSQNPENQTNVQPQNQPQQQPASNDDDVFSKYYEIQNPNFHQQLQQPYQDYQQPQPQYQQPNQSFQQQMPQQNIQQAQDLDLYDDFSQIVEQAKTMENFNLGLTEEQVVDMLDKDPVGFANHIAKTTMQRTLEMVQKFDVASLVEKNALDTYGKQMENERNTREGQAFINSAQSELSKQGIMMNDTQSALIFSTLAQNFPQEYQNYAQNYNQARIMGNLQNTLIPHNNGQMLTQQEFALKSVFQMAKGLTRGQQATAPKPYQKVTNNQIYQPSNSTPTQTKDIDNMTSEEFAAYRQQMLNKN